MSLKTKKEEIRINGTLKEITTMRDSEGKLIHKIIKPLMVEFHLRDILQVMIGASILAIPVGFTQETWDLGQEIALKNVLGFLAISLTFISLFVYYNFYRNHGLKKHFKEFLKRVISTYFVSFLVVALLLTLINKAPWSTDWILAFKRTVLVAFPASMSGAVADGMK